TGTGSQDGRQMGSLVGVVERGGAYYPYALLHEGPPGAEAWSRELRRAKVEALLRTAGVLP
ncbi:MAG TPA: hypothetical protein VD948_07895, partial [Rhodothermales bacterium]|nr:hypothetical protein [Rhodothermales bacterium]